MTAAVLSDIHGSRRSLSQVLSLLPRFSIQTLLIAGDIAPRGLEEISLLLQDSGYPVLAVGGNCDSPSDESALGFSLPLFRHIPWNGRNILLTHGHRSIEPTTSGLKPEDILITGHTHVPHLSRSADGIILLNPGSVTSPRGGSRPTFALITDRQLAIYDARKGACRQSLELKEIP